MRRRYDSKASVQPYVLLAEDDESVRDVVRATLQARDYEVVPLCDGNELYEHIERCRQPSFAKPDVVVTDVRMPGHSGVEALAWARQHGIHVPFVLITAYDDAGLRAEAQKHQAVAVLPKPFSFDELVDLVDRLVHRGPPSLS
jgi:CheY-like chemotaxis protein